MSCQVAAQPVSKTTEMNQRGPTGHKTGDRRALTLHIRGGVDLGPFKLDRVLEINIIYCIFNYPLYSGHIDFLIVYSFSDLKCCLSC